MKPVIKDLNMALTYHIEGMYDAEKKLQKYVPGLLKLASSRNLRGEIKSYLESAADKRTKLKRIFSYLLTGPFSRKNKAVKQMLEDAEVFSTLAFNVELRDAILIASMREIISYKVSAYTTARKFAEQLGLDQVTDLLDEVLEWERNTDKALSRITLKRVSKRGMEASLA